MSTIHSSRREIHKHKGVFSALAIVTGIKPQWIQHLTTTIGVSKAEVIDAVLIQDRPKVAERIGEDLLPPPPPPVRVTKYGHALYEVDRIVCTAELVRGPDQAIDRLDHRPPRPQAPRPVAALQPNPAREALPEPEPEPEAEPEQELEEDEPSPKKRWATGQAGGRQEACASQKSTN